MNDKRADDAFLAQVKTTLDDAEGRLDGATATRLRAARREAVASGRPSRPAWWLPAGAFAAASVALLALTLWQVTPGVDELPSLEDIALLSDPAEPEFYEELDFYMWLDEERQDRG